MIGTRKVLALIPARGGSKGIPGKNIVDLAGKPLISWTIEAAKACPRIDTIVLSSDDPTIAEVAARFGCTVPFTRPQELATDESSSMDVVYHALEQLPDFDVVVLLQPTSPLRTAADIEACLNLMQSAPAVVSVRPSEDHPYLTFEINDEGTLAPYAKPSADQSLRRQDLPGAWCLNGAIYAADTKWLREQRSFISPGTVAYQMPSERSIDIDTPADLRLAGQLLQLLHKN
ncbi:acylneuraminate cytidylyltransferase family protein [Undibacterium curvum]|uniref:Acylneuraminate cytidylyltransferase family protein n=1 Tax=Undibacterium curvum TaxID=2762294 RepID=A0ABR7A621_9BURK|nr:acylneuraminate cytidylyltransferase family protein [Undibacterium curvum]MBC3932351.1 acylneuraminate cytidylyltransferase family protein [Undibacterium curvum]